MNLLRHNDRAWLLRVLAGGLVAMLGLARSHAADAILVLKSRDLPQYSQAVNGFLKHWSDTGSTLRVQQKLLSSPTADARSVLGGDQQPRAVVAVGTEAAKWAIHHTTGPVVFCMIANARQNLVADLSEADARRVRGVSLDIPAHARLRALSVYVTKVKRVGVVYDPAKSGASIEELEEAAAVMGMRLIKQEVTRDSSLPEAIHRLAPQIDVLWAPVDSTVFNARSAQFVLVQMLERKVPVLGFSENMVKAGALLALQVDYAVCGEQTAQLLQAVLQDQAPAEWKIQPPRRYTVQINGHVQRLLGNPIPPAALQEVHFIDEE